ncbi:MAG: 50S ribosomal protein L6 [Patescibacteria group bacterium]|nr:50S ribosomal protein L6 [Patescibacteria group bacterium]
MSRVGKKPIQLPENVEISIDGQKIVIKGAKGELSREIRPEIKIEAKDNKIFLNPQIENNKTKAFWGLSRTLLANMVIGVTEGYEKKLELHGVGYRASIEGNDLVLQIGFSHPVKMEYSEGIKYSVDKNIIIISGIDKERVSQMAAKIRAIRPPEPYKGKGIRYLGEIVRRKVGKRAAATE